MLEAAYDYLRTTPPFRRWKLPAGEQVEFHVTRRADRQGAAMARGSTFIIEISSRYVGHSNTLLALMAHEMVHVRCDLLGVRAAHGSEFRRHAALVCKRHGFDPRNF